MRTKVKNGSRTKKPDFFKPGVLVQSSWMPHSADACSIAASPGRNFFHPLMFLWRVLSIGLLLLAWVPVFAATHGGDCMLQRYIDTHKGAPSGGLNCVSEDVRLHNYTKLSGPEVCALGEQINVSVRAEFQSGATERYDVGVFFTEQGLTPNAVGGTCYSDYLHDASAASLPPVNDDLDLTGGSGPFLNLEWDQDPLDVCGDIDRDNPSTLETESFQVTCTDRNQDGLVDLSSCSVWQTGGSKGTLQSPSCTSEADVTAETAAACSCVVLDVASLRVKRDMGDAPAGYAEAWQSVKTELYLGSLMPAIDDEFNWGGDGIDDSLAAADDDEEDGTWFDPAKAGVPGSYKVGISVVNTTGTDAVLAAWLDLDCSGTFDAAEMQTLTVTTSGAYLLDWGSVTLCDTDATQTFARVRLGDSSDFVSAPTPEGWGGYGEVEDYLVELSGVTSTPVVIADFAATQREQGGALVTWLTASEIDAAAFRLERRVSTGPQQQNERWQRVHQVSWIPALMAVQGGHYEVVDASVMTGEVYSYRIVEQTGSGARIVYGPYDVSVVAGEAPVSSSVNDYLSRKRLDVAKVAQRGKHAQKPAGNNRIINSKASKGQGGELKAASSLKLAVSQSGVYTLAVDELADYLKISTTELIELQALGLISLTTGGFEVDWYADPDGTFYFYGEQADSQFSATRTYWLNAYQAGSDMNQLDVDAVEQASAARFVDQRHFEEDKIFFLTASDSAESDYWFWAILSDAAPSGAFELQVPAAYEGVGHISVGLTGLTSTRHEVQVQVNGFEIGSVVFSGNTRHTQTLELPVSVFANGGDSLAVVMTLTKNESNNWNALLLDDFTVDYVRGYTATADRLAYSSAGLTTLGGFSHEEVVTMQVTDPRHPVWVNGGVVSAAGGNFSYSADLPLGDYVSSSSDGLLTPVSVVIDAASDLVSKRNHADYVIIATDELWEGAVALADYRSANLDTMVVNLQDIFDEFAWGEPDPSAIRGLVKASRQWRTVPRYFVLLGDGNFDYQDRMGLGYNIISPMMTGGRKDLHTNDTLLGDPDETGKPLAAVGRIPAKTLQQAMDYVAKVKAFENGSFNLPSMILTDRPDRAGNFTLSGQLLSSVVEGGQTILNAQGNRFVDVKADLIESLDQGLGLLNYIGHGGIDRLSGSGLLVNEDADSGLINVHTPVFVGLTCLVNFYAIPGFDSLGERLVMRPDAGVVASWAASGLSQNNEAAHLGFVFNDVYNQHERLGDVIIDAFNETNALANVYTLLGDPALKLQK